MSVWGREWSHGAGVVGRMMSVNSAEHYRCMFGSGGSKSCAVISLSSSLAPLFSVKLPPVSCSFLLTFDISMRHLINYLYNNMRGKSMKNTCLPEDLT